MLETVLIIVLSCLVVLLSILLARRYRAESKSEDQFAQIDYSELRNLILASASDESIQQVAGYVSKILRESCDCERILFFRKRRRFLELNYFHGVNKFNRRELRIAYTRKLVDELRGQISPEPIERIAEYLSPTLVDNLNDWQCTLQFPVFWRDHLYGVYFVSTTTELAGPAFKLLVATLTQSLGAAYHTRWQEERNSRLIEKVELNRDRTTSFTITADGDGSAEDRVLKLIAHRNSETLIEKIAEDLTATMPLEKYALVYESRDQAQPLRVIGHGMQREITLSHADGFRDLVQSLSQNKFGSLPEGKDTNDDSSLGGDLGSAGLKYAVNFSLSENRKALLAWSDNRPPETVAVQLKKAGLLASRLVENAELFEQVEELSYTDNLTGLANRRFFQRRLVEELERAQRHERKLSLIMFDLDELKTINDRYGHQAGDSCLQQMGSLLKSSVRLIDVIARYGGDEFCIVMPETDGSTCVRFMNRLQSKVETHDFRIDQTETEVHCTISQGGAVFPDHAQEAEQLIYSADMALLKAKESGRNRYKLY